MDFAANCDFIGFSEEPVLQTPVKEIQKEEPTQWIKEPRNDMTPFQRLHEEILDFCVFLSPSPAEHEMRLEVISRMEKLIQLAFPECKVQPFGSMSTRLYLPSSDIDLVIPEIASTKSNFLKIKEVLLASNELSYLEYIAARIPILKFTDQKTGIQLDLSLGIDGGLLTSAYFNQQLELYSALRPLVLLLKYFLHVRSLNVTFGGGVGSFMASLMVLGYLQYHQRLYNSVGTLGELFHGMLRFYVSINVVKVGISVKNNLIYKKKTVDKNRPWILSLENPLEPSLDVGQNAYLFMRVRRAFEYAISRIVQPGDDSILARILPIVEPIYCDRISTSAQYTSAFRVKTKHDDRKKKKKIDNDLNESTLPSKISRVNDSVHLPGYLEISNIMPSKTLDMYSLRKLLKSELSPLPTWIFYQKEETKATLQFTCLVDAEKYLKRISKVRFAIAGQEVHARILDSVPLNLDTKVRSKRKSSVDLKTDNTNYDSEANIIDLSKDPDNSHVVSGLSKTKKRKLRTDKVKKVKVKKDDFVDEWSNQIDLTGI